MEQVLCPEKPTMRFIRIGTRRDKLPAATRAVAGGERTNTMTQPVIGTPWRKLDRVVPSEELEGIDRYWR